MAKISDIERWRLEIQLSEKFREDEFGKFTSNERERVGENIDYFERGYSDKINVINEDYLTTLNIVDAIVSIIVPSLYFKNPRTIATPKRIESEDSAPVAAKTIDHYRQKLSAEVINQRAIWDAYVLGFGVTKIGYATQFGKDIPDEEKQKEKESRSLVDKGLERLGLKKKKEEKVVRPDINLKIVAENPFIEYISPFDFLMDIRATSLDDAMWWAHGIRKTVQSMKDNPKYKNTSLLKGNDPDINTMNFSNVSPAQQDAFKTVDLYEIHYRNEDKFYILVISRDSGDEWREHYHEESAYELGEWQVDMLTFKKHSHLLYPRSDITKLKNLQDRITTTIDSILEQVDKFVPKLSYSTGDLTEQGKLALENGGVGALVECNKNPAEVFKELNFTQLKADLQQLLDQIISLISIQTGLTRAQLTGLSDASTATEAQIEQGGQNIRIADMQASVSRFVNSQSRKFWKVIKQFVDLESLEMINGVKGIDQETGLPKYDWLTINSDQATRMQEGDFDFDIEVGSTEKVNLSVVRKAFENMFNILARPDVITLMQQQGDRVELAEILRRYFDLFPELAVNSGKIIQKIPGSTGLIPPEQDQGGGATSGSATNELRRQQAEPAPSIPQEIGASF